MTLLTPKAIVATTQSLLGLPVCTNRRRSLLTMVDVSPSRPLSGRWRRFVARNLGTGIANQSVALTLEPYSQKARSGAGRDPENGFDAIFACSFCDVYTGLGAAEEGGWDVTGFGDRNPDAGSDVIAVAIDELEGGDRQADAFGDLVDDGRRPVCVADAALHSVDEAGLRYSMSA